MQPRLQVALVDWSALRQDDAPRLKSMIHRTVVGLVLLHGAEGWPAMKEAESRLSVEESKMLCWTVGVMRLDRIRNDVIPQKFGIASVADQMREARLRRYGHLLRRKKQRQCP